MSICFATKSRIDVGARVVDRGRYGISMSLAVPPVPVEADKSRTTPILQDSIACLRALDLCDEVTPQTVYDWYLEVKHAGAREPDDALAARSSTPGAP